jgi:mannose-6-phosphate isomerase-like protein (cupin superfamily)
MSFDLRPVHVSSDAGESVFLVGDTYTVLLSAAQTGNEFSLVEALVPAQAGPPRHTHHNEAESFIVVEGQLIVHAGDDEYEVSKGGVVYIPKGTSHTFRNRSETKPAKMIILFTPSGMEGMFTDIGTPGVRGQVAPPLNDADIAAMSAAGEKYHYTFD